MMSRGAHDFRLTRSISPLAPADAGQGYTSPVWSESPKGLAVDSRHTS